MQARIRRWVECGVVFGLLPVGVDAWLPLWARIPSLWVVAGVVGWRLSRDGVSAEPGWRKVWVDRRVEVNGVLARFVIGALLMVAGVLVFAPHRWLQFPRERTGLWMAVVIFYPLLSVYPQELIYRRWFLRRYGSLFGEERGVLVASALAFGWMHVILHNVLAVALTIPGGWLFAVTYRRSGSLKLACLEHALYGDLIFTIGFGGCFYLALQ